jgi:hypothetical protein
MDDLNDIKTPESLRELESRLRNSASFEMLRENFKLFVRPDMVQKSLFQIWPIALSRSMALEIHYEMDWQVAKFFRIISPQVKNLGTF